VPFIAEFKIKYRDPVARDVGKAFGEFVWLSSPTYINVVDNYTIEWGIVKVEAGVSWFAVVLIGAVILGGMFIHYDIRVREIELEHKRIEVARPLVDKYNIVFERYLSELAACGNDQNCIASVQRLWLPVLQSISSVIGLLMSRTSYSCNGLNVGGVCIPWWVVGLMVFVAGLMVISALR
jgi:hypothetical protein